MKVTVASAIRYKIFFFFVGLVGCILLYYIYIFTPQNLRIAELTAVRQAVEQQNSTIQSFAKKKPDTDRYLVEVEKKAALADAILPNNADIGGFLIQLEKAATASGLQLCEVKPAKNIIKTNYQETSLEVITKGSFVQTLAFLQNLENVVRFNAVSSISVQSRQGLLEGKLTIIIYSYGVPSGAQSQPEKN